MSFAWSDLDGPNVLIELYVDVQDCFNGENGQCIVHDAGACYGENVDTNEL